MGDGVLRWAKLVIPLVVHSASKVRLRAAAAMETGMPLLLQRQMEVAGIIEPMMSSVSGAARTVLVVTYQTSGDIQQSVDIHRGIQIFQMSIIRLLPDFLVLNIKRKGNLKVTLMSLQKLIPELQKLFISKNEANVLKLWPLFVKLLGKVKCVCLHVVYFSLQIYKGLCIHSEAH